MSDGSRASVASMARYWSLESFPHLDRDDTAALTFTLERAADLLSDPVPWDEVADEAVGVMKAAADVAAKKAADDIYQRILDASMDYLENNLRFNIGATLGVAERERRDAQDRLAGVQAQLDAERALTREVRQRLSAEVTEEKAARLDLQNLAADECARADKMRDLLTRAREYVTDALDAHEHSDGRDLLKEIDAALRWTEEASQGEGE